MTDIAVWHRADLRTVDNAALAAAADDADRLTPVFVVDPAYYAHDALACDARLRFLHDCLADLRRQYRDLGTDLALLFGDPHERIPALLADGYEAYCNRDVTARAGLARDRTLLDREGVTGFADDGIRWPDERDPDGTVAVDTREDWDDHCEAYFECDQRPRPESLGPDPVDSDVTVGEVETRYGVTPEKTAVPEGGTVAGTERLSAFVDRLADYPGVVSPPAAAQARSSRLSPYLKFGALDERAKEALSDPRVQRRCSFSNRGLERTDSGGDDDGSGQASLSEF